MESERVAVDVNMTVKLWWILIYVIFRLGRFRVCSLLIENVRSVFSSVCIWYPCVNTSHFLLTSILWLVSYFPNSLSLHREIYKIIKLTLLILKISKRKWAQVGSSKTGGKSGSGAQMYLLKIGCNITALREFTALSCVDILPLKHYLLASTKPNPN